MDREHGKQMVERYQERGSTLQSVVVKEIGHRPSWSMFGTGSAELKFQYAPGAWLEIKLAEHRSPERTKPRDNGTSKVTYLTLTEETAREMFAALKDVFEPSTVGVEG